jgi:LiaI-LiaF-like transmembrane region
VRIHRGLLGWGVFFIVVGAVPLLVQAGRIDPDVVRRAWQLWPLILIGIGLGLVLQRTRAAVVGGLVVAVTFGLMVGSALAVGFAPGVAFGACGNGSSASGTAFPAQAGTLEPSAKVVVDLSCGQLALTSEAGTGWNLSGSSDDGQAPSIDASGSSLTIRSPGHRGLDFAQGSRWRLVLPTQSQLGLGITLNAGSATADVGAMPVSSLDLSVNAGDATISLAEATATRELNASVNAGSLKLTLPTPQQTLTGSLSANAGTIRLCVPAGAAIRIHASSSLGTTNFASAGLTKEGDTWVRDGSGAGIELDVSANLGTVNLETESGCA